jgi:CRISPR system Cascade subunit CasD
MQSWGVQSRFGVRDTGLEPSKSGVIGLLCAALGRSRSESVADLAALAMGVRVDREGHMARDYHTAENAVRADGTKPAWDKRFVESDRYYLADADFLVGLEGPPAMLADLNTALAAPVWPLYLGRKAFVPGEPVRLLDGLLPDATLVQALRSYPRRPPRPGERLPERLRLVLETAPAQGEPRPDVPLSFADRRFTVRHVRMEWLPTSEVPCS